MELVYVYDKNGLTILNGQKTSIDGEDNKPVDNHYQRNPEQTLQLFTIMVILEIQLIQHGV